MTRPTEGRTYTAERTYTREEVRAFADVSRDTQSIHTETDDEGRLVVHGLLTATLPTEIGSRLDFLATEMTFEFDRPVYTGDTVTCTWTNRRVEERDDRFEVTVDVTCRRDDERVMGGTISGLVWK